MTNAGLLRRFEDNVRAVGSQEREVVRLAAFDLFFSPSAVEYLSFALPRSPDPEVWAPHVAAMQAAFRERGKRPRLEYFEELHPRLDDLLEEASLVCQMRAPVMALRLERLPAATAGVPGRYQPLDAEDAPLLVHYLRRQNVAYGDDDDARALDWLPSLRSGLSSGNVMGAAWRQGEAPVAGAVIQIGAGTGELAGVWTDPQKRRQGLAYAVCRQLLAEYADAGFDLCWLSAAEGAQRLYEKLGFVRVGTQLNYG